MLTGRPSIRTGMTSVVVNLAHCSVVARVVSLGGGDKTGVSCGRDKWAWALEGS